MGWREARGMLGKIQVLPAVRVATSLPQKLPAAWEPPFSMKTTLRIALLLTLSPLVSIFTTSCQEGRTEALTRRQERMDARASARQERWAIRGEHMDARARGTLDSW